MKREICFDLKLDEAQEALLDNHSLMNLFNVLYIELTNLIEKAEKPELDVFKKQVLKILMNLMDPRNLTKLELLMGEASELISALHSLKKERPLLTNDVESILNILEIAVVRVDEFQINRFDWQYLPYQIFHEKLYDFLLATQKVSRSRYNFKFPPQNWSTSDYFVDFKIKHSVPMLFAPPVLNDTIRDLTANSRKYSNPGSMINIDLEQVNNRGIFIRVKDQGIGIPEDEIEQVVRFEERGSNVTERKTMGKGFGLTKAYFLTKMYNGNFWIDTEEEKGTTIEMTFFPN